MTSINATELSVQRMPALVDAGRELRLPVSQALPFPQLSDADKLDALLSGEISRTPISIFKMGSRILA